MNGQGNGSKSRNNLRSPAAHNLNVN
jgi:hypothetical protein